MDSESYKIICSNYPPEFILDKNLAKEYFKQFGKLKRVTFKIKLRMCVVEYATQEGYFSALNNAGEYKGMTFSVSSANESTLKKKHNSKNEPIWLDKDEIEEELAIMSGIVPTPTLKPLAGFASPIRDTSKLKNMLKQKEHTPVQKKDRSLKPTVRHKSNIKLSESVNTRVSGEDIELVNLVLSQGVTTEDKYRILEARDKLIKVKLKRNPPLKSSATIGTCPDMCPEKERLFREIKHQVAWYEQDENEKSMNYKKAIKQYSRSSADQEAPLAHELRPVNVLQMTMGYLLHNIIDLCDTDEVHLGEWFHFLWDRTRGIRKDITQQELCSQGAVELVEQCARFHIHCSARLVAEDPSVFDQKINTENLTKCLQTLKYMYHDLWLKGETCLNEAEFRAYIILLNLNDGNFMWEVQQLRREIQRSNEVQFAIQVYSAIDKNNYIKFFKLVYATSYLNSCILMRYFNQIRIMAIKTLRKCYLPRAAKTAYPVSELKTLLAFDDTDSTIDFLQYCSLSMNEEGTCVILDRNDFNLPIYPYILDRSSVIEDKRKYSVGRIICGKELPPKVYQTHTIENSFDHKGFLINKEILDDCDLEKVKMRLLEELDKSEAEIKEETSSKSPFFLAEKKSDPFAFVDKDQVDNPYVFVRKEKKIASPFSKKEEKIDNPFAIPPKKQEKIFDNPFTKITKTEEKPNNPFAFVAKEEKSDSSFSFIAKKEEKFSNPFAVLPQKESSKSGSIFDTAPPTPKNIFASPFQFDTSKQRPDFGSVSSGDKSDFKFVNPQFSFQPPPTLGSANSTFQEPKKGGFKFDLVLAPPKTQEATFSILPASEPKTTVDKLEQQKKKEEELRKKEEQEEQERLRALEEAKQWELKRKEEERQLELKRKELELKIKEEQKRLMEEKLKEEKRLKELKKKKQEEELKKRMELLKKEEAERRDVEIKFVVKNIITSLVKQVDDSIREEKLGKIKETIERRLLEKVFREWKVSVTKSKRKRKAVDCSPMWINSKSLNQIAEGLHTSSQELTLALMKRYKYGKPLDIGHVMDDNIKKVNLFELTYSILKNRIYELTINKPKNIFWKVVMSLPDEKELTIGLNRMEEAMENAFPWKQLNDRYLHLEQVKANASESVSYCIERQQGFIVKEFDANGIIFLAKDFNADLQRRIFENLKHFGVYTKVPIVIILQEYDPKQCRLEELIRENIVSDYVVLVENAAACKLVNVVEEGLVFLAKKVESSPPLELDTLKSFITKHLCTEIWKRANSFSKWNSSYKKCLQNPNVVVGLYNEGLTKLKTIILKESNKEYAKFPEEFKNYLNCEYPHFLPCSFRYFPNLWKTPKYLKEIEEILNSLTLPSWTDAWPPPNEYELELSVAKFTAKLTKNSDKLFYKVMSLLLRRVDPNVNFEDIQNVLWTDVVGLLGIEKLEDLDLSLNKDSSIFKEYFVVYDKNVLSEYKLCDWFYIYNPTIKKLVEEDLENEPVKENKKVLDIADQLKTSEDLIDSLWNSCWTRKSDKSEMIKELEQLKQSLNGLQATMAVHKKISSTLEESLKNAIAEK